MDNAGIYWILFFTLSVFFMTSIAVFLTRGRNRRAELMKGAGLSMSRLKLYIYDMCMCVLIRADNMYVEKNFPYYL